MTVKPVTIGSLFSGIAGLELGILAAFHEAGIPTRIAWQCEIDPFCSRVLAHHFPDVQRFSDVADVHNPPAVDVLCGGFACQDVSAAGKGAGLGKETRSGFTLFHLLRIIDEIRPPLLAIENVASGAKRWLPRVVQELRDRGYRPRAVPLGAVDVGAPHRRLRVFVVADRGSPIFGGLGGVRNGERTALWDDADGCGEGNVANGQRAGLEVVGFEQARRQFSPAERGCGAVPDADRDELREQPRGSSDAGSDSGATQSGMGGNAHGLPFDVAGHSFPAGRGVEQQSWEAPRAVGREMKITERPAKLRALGNAVVPQCGLVVGRVLVEMMQS